MSSNHGLKSEANTDAVPSMTTCSDLSVKQDNSDQTTAPRRSTINGTTVSSSENDNTDSSNCARKGDICELKSSGASPQTDPTNQQQPTTSTSIPGGTTVPSQVTPLYLSVPTVNNGLVVPSNMMRIPFPQSTVSTIANTCGLDGDKPPEPLVVDSALLRQRQLASANASNMAAQQQPTIHLRSGKWLPAEENYALLLVTLFERGVISDCVDGITTLRTYLSQKLHCAPMRISKKFAGRGIGKLVYSSKSSSEQENLPELLERLRVAEQLFLQAAYPPPIAASLGAAPFPLLCIPPTTQPVAMFPSSIMPGMVPSAGSMAAIFPTTVIGGSCAVTTDTMQAHTKQLHESYIRALQQADDESSNATDKKNANNETNVDTSKPVQLPLQTTPPAKQSAEIPDLLSGFEKIVQGMNPTSAASQAPITTTAEEYSPPFTSRSFDEFHRFLGKEELPMLDAPTAETPHNPRQVTTTCSNIHVTANAIEDATTAVISQMSHDTTALFTAESYAMLAQESAMEASQHSGYSLSLQRNNEFDNVERVIQQLGTTTHAKKSNIRTATESSSTSTTSYTGATTSMTTSHPSVVNVGIPHHRMQNTTAIPMTFTDLNTRRGTNTMNHHITASSQSDTNIVSGSEPSGSSSSRSNTNTSSSGTDSTGTSNDDCSDEGEGTVDSGCSSSSEDNGGSDKIDNSMISSPSVPPPRKKMKVGISQPQEQNYKNSSQQHGNIEKTKKVQFQ